MAPVRGEEGATVKSVGKGPCGLALHIAGAGPDFVIFHGGFGSWRHWIGNIEVLAERFRVLAFDLPGYGDSVGVPEATTPQQYIDWVSDEIAAAAPNGRHLAGFSFGGALAARVAARLGPRIKRLSLLGPGGFDFPRRPRRSIDCCWLSTKNERIWVPFD